MTTEKNNIGKLLLMATLIFSFFSICMCPSDVYANVTGESRYMTEIIADRGDVIVTKYKTINGKQYYRRWNQTQGVWVDPYWIPVS